MKNSVETSNQDNSINVKDILHTILKHWVYYLLTAILLGSIAVIYLKVTEPLYYVSTTLLIHDSKNKVQEAEILKQDGYPLGVKNLENELGLLHSYNLIREAIKSLDFEVSYYEKGMFNFREKYLDIPFRVQLDTTAFQLRNQKINIVPTTLKEYEVRIDDQSFSKICQFGEECSSDFFKFKVFKAFKDVPEDKDNFYIVINNLEELSEQYQNNLFMNKKRAESTLIELGILGTIPQKEVDFLNRLCKIITERNLYEKNYISSRTISFIDDQLLEVSASLTGAENELENFKIQENLLDLKLTASNATSKLMRLEIEQADLQTKQKYYQHLLKYLHANTDINSIVAPSSIGISDPLLNELIFELKKLHNEKVALNYTRTAKSNELNLINLQIENARKTLNENIININESLNIALRGVNYRLAQARKEVNKLPENERDLMRIQRNFTINDNLYNYLLQKRAEAGISKAASLPDHKIIDEARIVGGQAISPKVSLVFIITLVMTLVLPTLLILIKVSFNDKITEPEQIEGLTSIHVAGKIVRKKNKKSSVLISPHSILAECFRSLRVNLKFLYFRKDQGVIGFTSTVSGEGKSFCVHNLATVMAMTQKKVIIIEADLRNPRLIEYHPDLNYDFGLSNYLIDQVSLNKVIQPTHINNLSIISSGPIPPNPVELLESEGFSKLIEDLKKVYDFILIDAPPIGLVSDYVSISNNVDISLFVVRMNYSKTSFISDLNKDFEEGKYKNISLILNSVESGTKYGKRYAKYYHEKETSRTVNEKIKA